MTRTRQLAAIMFTDISGFSALMQKNEGKALQTREKHREVFNSSTKKHNGRILQYYGDGTLSVFNSAIEAVECGVEMQLDFMKEPSIPVRIGIHIGDIIFSEDEIIGDGVNVASRIESLAVPGSVFISDKVYDEIKNQESLKTSLLKTFRLKNIERPTDVYAICNEGLIVPNPEEIKGKTEEDPSTTQNQESELTSDPILETKLYIPPPLLKVVPRSRLIEQLDESQTSKLSIISAPPGFGKTTLVSEWIASQSHSIAWLSLDEADNDPSRFISYLVSAVQTIAPALGQGAMGLLQSPYPPPDESILTTLLNDIITINDDFTFVLDDFHVISAKQVEDAVEFLIDHVPPRMHLIITSRTEPNLSLGRLRVRGQLTEINAIDLRFTPAEASEFLNTVMGLSLSEENIKKLEATTEGWVAGLQLAALSMKGREDISGFVKAFAGDDRYVVDYLVEEVLNSLPEDHRSFLLKTSILERLNGPLCDAITEQSGGRGLLESFEHSNLFVLPLDNKRQWYRYHHLFADVLQSRLMEQEPDMVPHLNKLASEWYEKNGLTSDAIKHAITANEFGSAAGMLELVWPAMNKDCQATTWLSWVKRIPESTFNNRPVLIVSRAWALLQCGEMEAGETSLTKAEMLLERNSDANVESKKSSPGMIILDEAQFQHLPAQIANARAYHAQAHGDTAGTFEYSQRALELIPEEEYMLRAIPTALVGFIYWGKGDLDSAYKSFSEVMDSFKRAGDIAATIGITFILGDIRIIQGRFQDATNLFENSLKLALTQGEPMPVGIEDIYRGMGELDLERGDLQSALANLHRSIELGQETYASDWFYRRTICEARLAEVEGRFDEALVQLDKAEALFIISPMPEFRPVEALKARIYIKQGNLMKAQDWVKNQNLSSKDDLGYLREFEYITLARLLIKQYKSEGVDKTILEAKGLLKRLLIAAQEGERFSIVIEILVLQAISYDAEGGTPHAIEALRQALSLAEQEGYVRVFVDEGDPMAKLLTEAAIQGDMLEYVNKLLASFDLQKN